MNAQCNKTIKYNNATYNGVGSTGTGTARKFLYPPSANDTNVSTDVSDNVYANIRPWWNLSVTCHHIYQYLAQKTNITDLTFISCEYNTLNRLEGYQTGLSLHSLHFSVHVNEFNQNSQQTWKWFQTWFTIVNHKLNKQPHTERFPTFSSVKHNAVLWHCQLATARACKQPRITNSKVLIC